MKSRVADVLRSLLISALVAVGAVLALVPTSALAADTVPMLRLYNPWSGEHLFTSSVSEYDKLFDIGWTPESIAWQTPTSGAEVYRLYNPYSSDHHYTADASEYATLQGLGWRGEGISFYGASSSDELARPIYRLYNPWLQAGTHLYTTDKSEYDSLVAAGWSGEGVAFYGTLQSFTGTVEIVTGSQLASEEGVSLRRLYGSYASQEGKTQYAVLRLDSPQEVTGASGDGISIRTESASLVALARSGSYSAGSLSSWEGYAGQRVSVAVRFVWFPSDASLPLGEPRAWDAAPYVIATY